MIQRAMVGLALFGGLLVVGYVALLLSFDLFYDPIRTVLKSVCDGQQLRKITMVESGGNATVSGGIELYLTRCVDDFAASAEPVFVVAGPPHITATDVQFEWKGMNTVVVTFKESLQVFRQEAESSAVLRKVSFEYVAQ